MLRSGSFIFLVQPVAYCCVGWHCSSAHLPHPLPENSSNIVHWCPQGYRSCFRSDLCFCWFSFTWFMRWGYCIFWLLLHWWAAVRSSGGTGVTGIVTCSLPPKHNPPIGCFSSSRPASCCSTCMLFLDCTSPLEHFFAARVSLGERESAYTECLKDRLPHNMQPASKQQFADCKEWLQPFLAVTLPVRSIWPRDTELKESVCLKEKVQLAIHSPLTATKTHQHTCINAQYGVGHLCPLQRQLCIERMNKNKEQLFYNRLISHYYKES